VGGAEGSGALVGRRRAWVVQIEERGICWAEERVGGA